MPEVFVVMNKNDLITTFESSSVSLNPNYTADQWNTLVLFRGKSKFYRQDINP